MKVLDSQNRIIKIEKMPFASGGEGEVYHIKDANLSKFCIKIYKKQFRTKERERKVSYMVNNPPAKLMTDKWLLCWPRTVIYDAKNNGFLGFSMPMAFPSSELLYELCKPTTGNQLGATWSNKYSRKEVNGLESRLMLCVNISLGLNAIHNTKKYVLIDFKPQNVLVTHKGKVSIIDLDSIQIDGVFNAKVATAEYVPPEGMKLNPSRDYIPASWDHFAMAVVYYQILFGLHPYAITPQPSFSKESTIDSHIKNGLFPFGKNACYIDKRPALHDKFKLLPPHFRQLFLRSFDAGHGNPNLRPSAAEWGKTIYVELKQKKRNYQLQKMKKIPALVSVTPISKPHSIPIVKSKLQPKKYYLWAIICQLFGSGLLYLGVPLSRRWGYLVVFISGLLIFLVQIEGGCFIDGDVDLCLFLASLLITYVIGIIDVIVTLNIYNNRKWNK